MWIQNKRRKTMDQRQKNKGYLTEKVIPPEVIYSRGSIESPSTLQGTFSVNGMNFRIDGWHTINPEGRLYVSLQAYTRTRKARKVSSSTRRKYSGHMEEVPMNADGKPCVADKEHPVEMRGVLKINDIDYSLKGRAFITKAVGISIEFLIFAPKKAE